MGPWSESLEWLGHSRQERGFKYTDWSLCPTVFSWIYALLPFFVSRKLLCLILSSLAESLNIVLD